MWTLGDFVTRAARCSHRYQAEHGWFHWNDPVQYIQAAWKMYRCASQAGLGFLLLGDTKIRKEPVLVMNFGLASANGVQEAEELAMIDRLMAGRRGLETVRSGPAVQVLGPGSILSDAMWSPLLNDSFILGGVHRGFDFHLVEEGFDQFNLLGEKEFLARRDKFGPAAPQYAQALARGAEYYQARWKDYLRKHEDVFWREGIPRVFAREVLGLRLFGYAPRFSSAELGFVCQNLTAAGNADFEQYLDMLAGVGLQASNRTSVLEAIGGFLFGDAHALTA